MSLNIAEILAGCKLFSAVQPRGFQRLAVMARLCKFRKGQTIFREGEDCPGVYVVGRGMVRVYKTGPGGKEHVLHIVAPGGTFAEAAAIGGFEVPASAEAIAATTCGLLPEKAFHNLLAEDHELCLGMMTGLTLWLRHLVGLMEDVVLRDAAGRIAALPAANAPRRGGLHRVARLEAARGQPLELDQRDVFADLSPPVGRRHDCGVRPQSAATARLRQAAEGRRRAFS